MDTSKIHRILDKNSISDLKEYLEGHILTLEDINAIALLIIYKPVKISDKNKQKVRTEMINILHTDYGFDVTSANIYTDNDDYYINDVYNPMMMKLLIEMGLDIKNNNEEILIQACKEGSLENVRSLLELGVNPNIRGGYVLTSCIENNRLNRHYGKFAEERFEIIKLLVSYGLDPNVKKALDICIIGRYYDLANFLCENGLNVNLDDDDENYPLIMAIQRKSYIFVKLLLDYGADVSFLSRMTFDDDDDNSIEEYEKMCNLLVSKGVDLMAVNKVALFA